jgi:tetratricopeptide (TPR) repeat protein
MHVGANHYYIHAVEASRTPDRALASAKRLETLVPAAGHLVHMPAHIYMRTGNYDGAVTSNAKAAEVDRAYIKATGAGGVYPSMYYNHNLDFLASAAMMSGQFATAKKAADELITNVTPALAEMAMLEPFAAKTLFVLLRFARWDDVLKLPEADAKFPLLVTLSHFGRGIAHAARGNLAEAEKRFKSVVDSAPQVYATQARLSLAQVYAGEGKPADAQRVLQPLIDKSTETVSKEEATLLLAQILVKSNPEEARKLAGPLRTSTRAAVSRAANSVFGDILQSGQ